MNGLFDEQLTSFSGYGFLHAHTGLHDPCFLADSEGSLILPASGLVLWSFLRAHTQRWVHRAWQTLVKALWSLFRAYLSLYRASLAC